MREATTQSKVDFFRLPRPLWRKLKKHLTRWSEKAENWLPLIQLACAHVLLDLAVFG